MNLAYRVGDDEEQEVIFTSNSESMLFNNYEVVERCPNYDQYEKIGYVPSEVLINDGWWIDCSECETTVRGDYWDYENDVDLNPVFIGNSVFCCQACYDKSVERIEAIRQSERRVTNFLMSKYPEISNLQVYACTDEAVARFKFPGSKYEAEWRTNQPDCISYCQVDKEAAIAYFKIKTA
jgi:hypothetical protein